MLVVSSLSRDVFDTRHCLLFDVTGLAAFSCLLFPAGFLVLPSRFVVSSYCPVRGLSQLAVSRMMLLSGPVVSFSRFDISSCYLGSCSLSFAVVFCVLAVAVDIVGRV